MAKRKKASKAEETETLYVVGTWAGQPHYTCLNCKFDTLELQVIEQHVVRHRPGNRTPQTAPRGIDNVDHQATADSGDLNQVFEVELQEVDSTIDEQGNEHKTYTIKE